MTPLARGKKSIGTYLFTVIDVDGRW